MWFNGSPRIRLIPIEKPPKLIRFSILPTKFGRIIMGIVDDQNEVAICLIYFVQKSDKETLEELRQRWPKSELLEDNDRVQCVADKLFEGDKENNDVTSIAILGTEFQQAVWSALVGLKSGETCTYAQLAERMERPKAVRAVANAVAKNEVAVLIPCHRIVSQNGATKYHWGSSLKQQLLTFEKSSAPSEPASSTDSESNPYKRAYVSDPTKTLRLDGYDHWPEWGTRGRCRVCSTGIPSCKCSKCNVHLCCNPQKNCFLSYHTEI